MSGATLPPAPRIVLVRHGRSAHLARGWLDAGGLRAWFAAYDAAGIADDDAPPALRAEAARAGIVVASDLPRAHLSAERLAPGAAIARSPLLRETPLALPAPGRLRLPLLGWALLVGARSAVGALRREPAHGAARAQAAQAAAWLIDLAARHGGVLAVTHANLRAHVAAALAARGWTCARRSGRYAHWSAWTFAPDARSRCVQAPDAAAGDDGAVGGTPAADRPAETASPEPAMHPSVTAAVPPATRVERFDAIVVGGGQAGLAVGHHLAARDVDFVVLDAERRVGDAWRRRWESLRLFTPAAYNGLPGMPFPAPPAHLPDRDEMADYLERYAERFDLPVRSETRVDGVAWDGERWVVRAGDRTFEADSVVVATGAFQRPHVPDVAARLAPDIVQLHSSRYRSPFDLPDGPALVVGAGNSGAQIALELARFRKVWLAGRDTGALPRRVLGRDLFAWLWPLMRHATVDTRLGRRVRERARHGGDPRIGILARALAGAGIVRVGRVEEARGGLPVCDGEALQPSVVVWCTGFAPDYGWLAPPVLDADGRPRHRRGVATDAPGLYFVGLRFQHRMSSSLVGGVGEDAAHVAAHVARRAERAIAV